jgi:23S rRNA pseudouridine1911/1915/1917 synthase
MKRKAVFIIPTGAVPENLLDFLARRFTYHTPGEWQDRLDQGRVSVNQRPGIASDRLEAGDQVEYVPEDRPEPAVDFGMRLVFEDSDLLVIDKPGNLPCHPAGVYFNHTVWALLKADPYRIGNPAFVNRLDRETSGLVVVAKNPESAKAWRAEFAGRRVEKVYRVLVEGLFPEQVTACGVMKGDPGGPVRKRRLFAPGGSAPEAGPDWAETDFRCLSRQRGMSLVEARPLTGRLHQIRATLHALGFPVVGDKLYGIDPALFLRFRDQTLTEADRIGLRLDRQALHAFRLRLRHPRTREDREWEAPMPADILGLMGET